MRNSPENFKEHQKVYKRNQTILRKFQMIFEISPTNNSFTTIQSKEILQVPRRDKEKHTEQKLAKKQ